MNQIFLENDDDDLQKSITFCNTPAFEIPQNTGYLIFQLPCHLVK